MPKVDGSYYLQKRNQILDAAMAVAMRKPMYEISMRDIIKESGLSQGSIYRYFNNADEIYIALINRDCTLLDSEYEMKKLLNSAQIPEVIIGRWLTLWKQLVFDNLLGVGKIFFELCTIYANNESRLAKRKG